MPPPNEHSRSPAPKDPSHPTRPRRYEPTPLYVLAERLRRKGVDLQNIPGPWRPLRRALRRPGRNADRAIPIVTNGRVEIAVDTAEHAVDLSGFLNAAGLDHLDPIPSLRPPDQDLMRGEAGSSH
jgi:hypothetical protein